MKNKYLSQEEKEIGLVEYMKHTAYNGLGISFLSETTVYLMAIYYNASNLQLGYISSLVHLSGIILIIIPRLINGMNIVKVQYYSWLGRGLVCGLYGLLFFMSGQQAVLLILCVYTLFSVVRMVGITLGRPIQQMLISGSNIGEIIVKFSNRFHSARIVSYAVSALILSTKFLGVLPGLLLIQVLGIVTNTMSAYHLNKLPCREVVEYQPGRNIFLLLKENLANREKAMILALHWLSLGLMILLTFTIPFIRKILNFPDYQVFLYTIVTSFSIIASGFFIKPFVDRIGSKPIMILSSFGLAALTLVWAFLSPDLPWGFVFILGFFTVFFQGMLLILVTRLFMKNMPEKDKITYTSMVYFFTAIIALSIGLFGGYLIDVGESLPFPYLHDYSLVFFLLGAAALGINVFCYFLEDRGSLSVWETAQILLSTRSLKAYLDIYQFNMTDDPIKKKTILLSIGNSDTNIATEEIRKILKNPLSTEKGELLKALYARPREALLIEIMQEACDIYSYHRGKAIFALGAYPNAEVEQLLIKLLDDPSIEIRSIAAKSLARVGSTSELVKIIALSKKASNIWERMNFFIAISIMDQRGTYLSELFDVVGKDENVNSSQTMFSLCARVLEMSPSLSELYQLENERPVAGFSRLLDEAKQLQVINKRKKLLKTHFKNDNFIDIFQWCSSVLENQNFDDYRKHLKHSIRSQPREKMDQTSSLAALYFTYQILR